MKTVSLYLLLGFLSANVIAASKDPINIEADNAKIIEKEGKSVYTGNVILIQGDTRMTADSVTVFSESGKLTQITATGRPVRYEDKGVAKNSDISGEANLLEYYTKENRILLLNNAKLTQGRTQFSGNRIEYNTETDVVTAEVSKTGSERVQVIIEPEKLMGKQEPDAKPEN
ncbi:lipopolysaccharide transport periplasmic protein LptA [Kaarinaea lacus]